VTGLTLPSHARGAAPDLSVAGAALSPFLPDVGPTESYLDAGTAFEKTAAARPQHNGVAARLPLGSGHLKETRAERRIAKGVTLTVIRRGDAKMRKKSTDGPWVIRVLTIDPDVAEGYLTTTYGSTVANTTPVTKLTKAAKGLLGVNASYFAIGSRTPGNPVGLTIANGKVLSDPSGMKREVTLLVDSDRNQMRIEKVRWSGRVVAENGKALRLTKVNAVPRVPEGCRTKRSQARCQASGQVAVFTERYGSRTPSGVGTEAILDRKGCAVKVKRHRGTELTGGRWSIQATGASARDLRAMVRHGCVEVQNTVRDSKGRKIELTRATSAVSGRFQLLRNGRNIAPRRMDDPFFHRHPRTIAGTTWDGKIKLVTIDGRSHRSVGVTLPQAADIAWALGMRDAVNLDGGGSTTMSIRGRLANDVSGSRERAVSDALVWRRDY
jgi:exopolysaccharide biosynthesis protein